MSFGRPNGRSIDLWRFQLIQSLQRNYHDFTKANDKAKIVAGMYNEQMLDVAGVKQLASILSRDELLAMVMGVMQQIPASFVRLVSAT